MFLEYSELTSKVSAFIFWYIYFVKSFFELQKPSTYVCMCIYIYIIYLYMIDSYEFVYYLSLSP